jgi:CDGSH-type Zn-finger protein
MSEFMFENINLWEGKWMSNENKVIIKVNDNGSLRVTGPVELVDAEGNLFEHKESFSLCRCGASNNKPFCDGTHKSIGFTSAPRANKN